MDKRSIVWIFITVLMASIVSPALDDECDICGGSGELTCLSCGGSGEVNCPYCYGTSWIPCSKCYGSGLFTGEKCSICDGMGKIKCKRCEETGKVVCAGCGGSGAVNCPECSRLVDTAAGDSGESNGTAIATDAGETTVIDESTEAGEAVETTHILGGSGTPETSVASAEWSAEYNEHKGLFDDYSVCELKDFVYDRGYRVVTPAITPSAVDGRLNIDFIYIGAGNETGYGGSAIWERLPEKGADAGALLEVKMGDKLYKRDGWTFTSYPDYYFWDYEGEWDQARARTAEWRHWKTGLALQTRDLPKLIEKKAKKTELTYKPKKKHIYIIEPDPELYAFEDGDIRATLWRRYLELVGYAKPYIDRDGYYLPSDTIYWWYEKVGGYGSVNMLYVLGSFIVSGEDVKSGTLGQVLVYTESVSKKETLSFYKPDGYGGLYKIWEEEANIEGIE